MSTKIFISYCSDDENKMRALERIIKKTKELEPVIVSDRRTPRVPLEKKVKDGILESDYMIPILTSNSIYSQWVNQEVGFAEGNKIDIYPIVEKLIINKLKGFIHKNSDLPHQFECNSSKKKKAANFRKCAKLLVEDIVKLQEKKDLAKSSKFRESMLYTLVYGYKATEIEVDHTITKKSKFMFETDLKSVDDKFTVYFLFITDRDERKWVGFTNRQTERERENESTKSISEKPKLSYKEKINIFEKINERFKNLRGDPSVIKKVRFRGDRTQPEPLQFYYAFVE